MPGLKTPPGYFASNGAMHESYMRAALSLARKGAGKTSPNPMVGSVLVKRGKVVGKGYHRAVGKPHAEIEALKRAGKEARGATMYVNLEPCCHQGRTPPCTDALIKAGIKEVVAAMEDPNPAVSGTGFKRLQDAGIRTVCGVLEERASELNEAYIKHITTGLPQVIMKAGMSLDGKIATASGESRWITGEASRRQVHRLRAACDAVMVGAETVIKDDPRLTARIKGGIDPVRVIVDSRLRLPLSARIFDRDSDAGVVIATTKGADVEKKRKLEALEGVTVITLDGPRGRVDLPRLMKNLGKRGVTSLLLEGGGEVNAAMLDAGLVDKVMLFVSPVIIGGKNSPDVVGGGGASSLAQAVGLERVKYRRIGGDLLMEGYITGN